MRAIKQAVSGHSTLRTCLQIAGSLDIVDGACEVYRGRKAFDEHSITRHSVPSPLADQVKGAWFCVTCYLV